MPNKYLQYITLKNNLKITQKEIEELQYKKLKQIINYAYKNIPFYQYKFNSIGVKPKDIKKISDIEKLPYITKTEIQNNTKNIINTKYNLSKLRKNSTSGSTGTPLSIYSDSRTAALSDASWIRAYLENGMKINDKMAVIRTPKNFPKKKPFLEKIGILKRRYITVEHSQRKQRAILEEYEPDIIRSYPSTLTNLVESFSAEPLDISPKKMFTSAELVDSYTRRHIEDFFGGELFDHYSCNEVGLIAWECSDHNGYHINSDNIFVEILTGSTPAQEDEIGEIVLTDLNNVAMPIIRYKIGDLGRAYVGRCSCGNNFPLLHMIEGRKDDMLYTVIGTPVSPHMIKNYLQEIFEDLGRIKAFRVVQKELDELILYLVLAEGIILSDSDFVRANKVFKKVFGDTMNLVIEIKDKIDHNHSGKRRMSESQIKF